MDPNTTITNQPIFYLFIAFTILLILGYSWGRRKNTNIYKNSFQELLDIFKPKNQKFTNIGGLAGYHANILPKNDKVITRVDATITLLPRQAWLYYPFSRLMRGFDRLFITLHLREGVLRGIEEGHLIEKRYSRFKGPKITNQGRLHHEEIDWEGLQFIMYYSSSKSKQILNKLLPKKGLPGQVRHIALVPEQNRAFIFIIPKAGAVSKSVPKVFSWLDKLI